MQKPYEDLAIEFQYQWIKLLQESMRKHDIPDEIAIEICGDFTFSLSMLLDQGRVVADNGCFKPMVAFLSETESLLLPAPEFDYHDYAFGSTDEAYGR